jgi:hypothetical protein
MWKMETYGAKTGPLRKNAASWPSGLIVMIAPIYAALGFMLIVLIRISGFSPIVNALVFVALIALASSSRARVERARMERSPAFYDPHMKERSAACQNVTSSPDSRG